MSEYVPDPWTFLLLGAAAWRVFALISSDKILETTMNALLRRVTPVARRDYWREFLECPYCLGFWLALAWWGAWLAFPTEATIFAVPWALSALVALIETTKNALVQ